MSANVVRCANECILDGAAAVDGVVPVDAASGSLALPRLVRLSPSLLIGLTGHCSATPSCVVVLHELMVMVAAVRGCADPLALAFITGVAEAVGPFVLRLSSAAFLRLVDARNAPVLQQALEALGLPLLTCRVVLALLTYANSAISQLVARGNAAISAEMGDGVGVRETWLTALRAVLLGASTASPRAVYVTDSHRGLKFGKLNIQDALKKAYAARSEAGRPSLTATTPPVSMMFTLASTVLAQRGAVSASAENRRSRMLEEGRHPEVVNAMIYGTRVAHVIGAEAADHIAAMWKSGADRAAIDAFSAPLFEEASRRYSKMGELGVRVPVVPHEGVGV